MTLLKVETHHMGNLGKYGSGLLQVGDATSVHPGIRVRFLISGICFLRVGAGGSNGWGGIWGLAPIQYSMIIRLFTFFRGRNSSGSIHL